MDVTDWLRGLGLEQYAPAFQENNIGGDLLTSVTADDLKDLGVVSVGHRRRLLEGIAALRAGNEATCERPKATALMPERSQSSTQPDAERRQVTVMFCDLVGSTALASRLDPEDLREVIGRYQACVAATVTRYDGFVAKYMGDGVLVYFGYPRAHEDDAEQAVRAGLALIDAVGELAAPERLQVRIGIATGLVVVGDLIGAGSAQEQAIVGETPNLAARLQALAEPNAIVIAESTRRQIGALFELADLGPQSLKGFSQSQRAWRVLVENRSLGRFEALRSRATPLVGRDEEMELLLRRWSQAKSSSGRVVLISADPGIGKSRLAEALAERISAEPHIRLSYFCSPHHQDSALYPIIAQMERAAGFSRDDAPEERLRKLEALLAQSSATEDESALIAALLSVPAGERYRVSDMSSQRRKEKTLQALLVQPERLSAKQPVLMIFEDAHWIDPTSLELLTRSVERQGVPALLLITARPEFTPPWPAHAHVTTLPLARLDRQNTATIVANIAGNQALSPDIMREIAERTDGVPLFVEELTKAVLESGGHGAAALSAVPLSTLSVPATLHASLMARLDRLGPAAKEVAQKGAVIGREFNYDLLALIADQPEPELRDVLTRLANAGLLFERGTPPQSVYIFKHALVQEAAYGTLLRGRRQQLHGRIASVLEKQFPAMADAQLELLAQHFTEAGQTERAVEYRLKAGQQALARASMMEAESLLRKGLVLIASLPNSTWRQEQELDLQIGLGRALFQTQGFGALATAEVYTRARQLCDALNQGHKLLPILYGQWVNLFNGSDLEPAEQLAAEMRRFGEMRNDVPARVVACRASGGTSLALGNLVAARAYLERGLALYDPRQRPLYADLTSIDTRVALLDYLSQALAASGYIDQARLRWNEALAEARQVSHAPTLVHALVTAWEAGWCARTDPMTLLRYTEEALALSAERGFAQWRAMASAARGWCLAELGRAEEGIALLADALPYLRESTVRPLPFMLLAAAKAIAGRLQAALVDLEQAEQVSKSKKEGFLLAETLRHRGDLLTRSGDHAGAELAFRNAMELAGRQGARLFELRAATSLARLWHNQGRGEEARDLLAPIYTWFTEGFDALDLKDARAMLDELNASDG